MPTPRPTIMQRINEKSGTSMNADSTPTPAAPTKTPTIAVKLGGPTATAEPTATGNTIIATAMPTSALLGASSAARASSPVKLVCTPAARVIAAAEFASSSWVFVNLSIAYATSTYAVRPSALTALDCEANGSVTAVTLWPAASRWRACSMLDL